MSEEERLEGLDRRLNRSSLVVVLIAMPLILFLHSAKAALSVGAGAVLSYINFHWLKQAVDFVVLEGAQGRKERRTDVHADRRVARYVLIALFLYVTIHSSVLDLVFVFAGLLVYVVAILIECVSEVFRVLIQDYRNART